MFLSRDRENIRERGVLSVGSTDVQGGGGEPRYDGSMKIRNQGQRSTCACDCSLIVDNASRPPRELKLHITECSMSRKTSQYFTSETCTYTISKPKMLR